MIHISKFKTREICLPTMRQTIGGQFTRIEAFKGREIKGTGTPDKWIILHWLTDTIIHEFSTHEACQNKWDELQAQLDYETHIDPDVPMSELASTLYKRRYGFEYLPGKGNDIIEVAGSRRIAADNPWPKEARTHPGNNLITTNGRENRGGTIGNVNLNQHCQIGTGTATEVLADTALGNYDRTNDSVEDSVQSAEATAPYFGWVRKVYRFDPPGTNDIYAELGISHATTGNLFSRARIKNAGVPTTIAVDDDEWLDVTYELRQYPDHLTVTNDTVDGYDIDILASDVNSTFNGIVQPERPIDQATGGYNPVKGYSDDAVLGAVTGSPTATTSKSEGSAGHTAYVASSYEDKMTYSMSISQCNFGGNGIGAIVFGANVHPNYQVLFDPPIPKTASDVVDIGWTFDWAPHSFP